MKLTFAILLAFLQLAHGQDTKLVTRKSGEYQEDFHVLKSDKSIKQGEYKKRKGDVIAMEGTYENNEKVGEWKYYTYGVLDQIYNHSSKELTYYLKPSYSLKYTGDEKLDTPPLFIGGKEELDAQLNAIMKYPEGPLSMKIEGNVTLSFVINEDNSVSEVYITAGIHSACDKEFRSALLKIANGWLAGKKDNTVVRSPVTLTIQFRVPGKILLL